MIITKAQSKQLRYACGNAGHNQPCTRKYTGTPEGKLREIGKFKYLESGGELKYFTFNGRNINLDGITFDILHAYVQAGEGLDPILVEIPIPAMVEPHPVDVPVEVEVHSGMRDRDAEFTAIDELNPDAATKDDAWKSPEEIEGWTEPDETGKIPENANPLNDVNAEATVSRIHKGIETIVKTPENMDPPPPIKEPTAEGYVEPDLPDITPQHETPLNENGLPKIERNPMTRDEFETALRETAMNAAAREALRLCNIECGPECYIAANIIRANATVPHFLDNYGKCLEKVGNPLTIAEIAEALPAQKKWLDGLAFAELKVED